MWLINTWLTLVFIGWATALSLFALFWLARGMRAIGDFLNRPVTFRRPGR